MKELCIVIPVYNVEKYLNECVDSLLKQMDERCELLLIDDGSTDNSGYICDSYNNENVAVYHQNNSGAAEARNRGIELSTANYICFVDADDIIAENSIPIILEWIKTCSKTDLCMMRGIKIYPDGHIDSMGEVIDRNLLRNKKREDAIKYLSTLNKFPGSACTKVFRKDFLIENEIRFSSQYKHAEDIDFVLRSIKKASSFDALNCDYYQYRQERENSTSNTMTIKAFRNLKDVLCANIVDIKQEQLQNVQKDYLSFIAYEYVILLWESSVIDKKYSSEMKKSLRELKWVLEYGKGRKYGLIRHLLSIIGFKNTAFLLKLYLLYR